MKEFAIIISIGITIYSLLGNNENQYYYLWIISFLLGWYGWGIILASFPILFCIGVYYSDLDSEKFNLSGTAPFVGFISLAIVCISLLLRFHELVTGGYDRSTSGNRFGGFGGGDGE